MLLLKYIAQELAYYGVATPLSAARCDLAATSVGDYALFGGGYTGSYSAVVDAYNTSLTRSTPHIIISKTSVSSTSVGNLCFIWWRLILVLFSCSRCLQHLVNKEVHHISSARRLLQLLGRQVTYALFGFGGGRPSSNLFRCSRCLQHLVNKEYTSHQRISKKMYLAATSVGNLCFIWWRNTSSGSAVVCL